MQSSNIKFIGISSSQIEKLTMSDKVIGIPFNSRFVDGSKQTVQSKVFQTYQSIYNERSVIESPVLRALHYEKHWCNHPEH